MESVTEPDEITFPSKTYNISNIKSIVFSVSYCNNYKFGWIENKKAFKSNKNQYYNYQKQESYLSYS